MAILSIGEASLVEGLLDVLEPGGRLVLFAGFGDRPGATLDLNRIHYRELVGRRQRVDRHAAERAPGALRGGRGPGRSGEVPVERLVTGHCGLDGLVDAFAAVRELRGLKTVLLPGAA